MGNRIRELRDARGLSQAELGRRIGATKQQISHLEHGRRRLTDTWIHKLAAALAVSPSDLLAPEPPSAAGANRPKNEIGPIRPIEMLRSRLPVYPVVQAGDADMAVSYNPVEWIDTPPVLAGVQNGYGMYVVSDSMEPRLRQGDMVYVHPSKPPKQGDLVVCILKRRGDETEHVGYLKEFAGRSGGSYVFRQTNPAKELRFPIADVQDLHKVVGVAFG